MKKYGKELEFISWVKRDGSGTVMCGTKWDASMDCPKVDDMSYLDEDRFKLTLISASRQTFIASGFNTFVVKLKRK